MKRELETFLHGAGAQKCDDLGDGGWRRKRDRFKVELTAFDLGEVEDVVEQP